MNPRHRNPWVALLTLLFLPVARLIGEGVVRQGLAESGRGLTSTDREDVDAWLARRPA